MNVSEFAVQIPVAMILVVLATYIAEREKSVVHQKDLQPWHWWHLALPNEQWAFASFYAVFFRVESSGTIRAVGISLFCISLIIFGFATRFSTRISKLSDPKCFTTPDEKRNSLLALLSFILVVVFSTLIVPFLRN